MNSDLREGHGGRRWSLDLPPSSALAQKQAALSASWIPSENSRLECWVTISVPLAEVGS